MGSDVMERVAKYVWQIAPQDYLPPNEEFAAGGYVFTVNAEGNEVFFVTEEHEFNHSVLENAEENLRSYCDAVQLQEFRSYGLKPNSLFLWNRLELSLLALY
jgi:hypothetical protein